MALDGGVKAFGLLDLKIKVWSGGSLGSAVDIPGASAFKFAVVADDIKFVGDDRILGVASTNEGIEFELAASVVDLDVDNALTGGTKTDSGTAPNQIESQVMLVGQGKPWFLVEGQSLGDGIDDLHGRIYKCKVKSSRAGDAENGNPSGTTYSGLAVAITSAEATAIGGEAVVDAMGALVHNETATATS